MDCIVFLGNINGSQNKYKYITIMSKLHMINPMSLMIFFVALSDPPILHAD
jgi:hypothetical protein